MLAVSEEFVSLQGEGFMSGQKMYFVRTQGCSVGCYFCDTKYTWKESDQTTKEDDIIRRALDSKVEWMCITGGEPLEQDLTALVLKAQTKKLKVQIETSGQFFHPIVNDIDWVTVSPKDLFSKLNPKTNELFVVKAHEFKCVVTKSEDVDYYLKTFGHFNGIKHFQPVDNNPAIACMMKDRDDLGDWRVTCQQQKVFNLR